MNMTPEQARERLLAGKTNLSRLQEIPAPHSVLVLRGRRAACTRALETLLDSLAIRWCRSADRIVLRGRLGQGLSKATNSFIAQSRRTGWFRIGLGLVCIIGLAILSAAAQIWVAYRSTQVLPAGSLTPGFGALDELDRLTLQDDLSAQRNVLYWLRRLAALSVDEMPVESLPAIVVLAQHPDPTIR